MKTAEELVAQAREDHAAVNGRIIFVRDFTTFIDDDSFDVICELAEDLDAGDSWIACRVLPATVAHDLEHWVDEWLDPYWDVQILDLTHPSLPADFDPERWSWAFGPSYNVKTGQCSHGNWRLATQEEIRRYEPFHSRLPLDLQLV